MTVGLLLVCLVWLGLLSWRVYRIETKKPAPVVPLTEWKKTSPGRELLRQRLALRRDAVNAKDPA